MARKEKIADHEALDRIARENRFDGWSLLSRRITVRSPSTAVLSRLADGDLLLLGARPGHGKTMLGLQILLDAAREGRKAVFFSLEYTEQEARERIRLLEGDAHERGSMVEIVTSDDISADTIIKTLSGSAPGTVAIIDYLQILDQRRSKPALSDQMPALREFACSAEIVLGFISQIDRSFAPERKPVPDIHDIRLPNLIDLGVFSKACFLHNGEVRFHDVA